ncbi:MAG: hypothetical protein ACK55I_31935, partial [bacterium]
YRHILNVLSEVRKRGLRQIKKLEKATLLRNRLPHVYYIYLNISAFSLIKGKLALLQTTS